MRKTSRHLLALLALVALLVSACGRDATKAERPQGLPKLPGLGAGSGDERSAMAADAMLAPGMARELKLDLGTVHPFDQVPAYRLAATAREAEVKVLAKALGLKTEVEHKGKGWVATDGDLELNVEPLPGAPWYFGPPQPRCEPASEPAPPDGAVSSKGCAIASGGGSTGSGSVSSSGSLGSAGGSEPSMGCEMPPCAEGQACAQVCPEKSEIAPDKVDRVEPVEPVRPAGLPTKDQAEERGREVLLAAGVMADGSSDVEVFDGFDSWNVNVRAEANGVEVIGLDSSVGIGVGGRVIRGNGWLAPGERIGDYPLVSAEKAFERLKAQQGTRGETEMLGDPVASAACPDPSSDAPVTEVCTTLPIAPLPPLVLTTVRPVLLFRPTLEAAYLVPGFAFGAEASDATPGEPPVELTVVAVEDKFLETESETGPGDARRPVDGASPTDKLEYAPIPPDGKSDPAVKPER